MAAPPLELPLTGAGGEPVDLRRTIASHGLASLPPLERRDGGRTLLATLRVDSRARTVRVWPGAPGHARLDPADGRPLGRDAASVRTTVAHMLRLDEDLSPFYALASTDPRLAWVTRGAGRLLRSPTVFEDVVKTICTTNCAWSGTVRMVSTLVGQLGIEAPDGRRAFPTPAAMAAADGSFYRDVARAGYRGPYLRAIASDVAAGTLDLEALGRATPDELPDEEVAARLLELPGIGPYAAAHVMLLLGRYSRLVLDSWTRPTYARLTRRKQVADETMLRRFRRYRRYAGLAFWLFLTREWVAEGAADGEPR